MEDDIESWLKELAEPFLHTIGVRPTQQVLDFGCGRGYYVIPLARLVGPTGKIYAQDKSPEVLQELRQRAQQEHLSNIEIILTSGELAIPLDDQILDVVLLYDVIHSYYFTQPNRITLLNEIRRVLKPGALFSFYPSHMNLDRSRKLAEDAGFQFTESIQATLLHFGSLKVDRILNFQRV